MTHIKIGIVGSRRRDSKEDFDILAEFLSWYLPKLEAEGKTFSFVSGGCPQGADRFAKMIAVQNGIHIDEYPPDKSKIRKDLPYEAAYAIVAYERNTIIARESDILIALIVPDSVGGTDNTVATFRSMRKGAVEIL